MTSTIKTSTLRIFKDTRITPDRNFEVDDIEEYLATCETYEVEKYQYQKHAYEKTIKIDYDQSMQEFEDSNDFNYCAIQNYNSDKVVYYFIIDKKTLSQKTMELTLQMDTANTFKAENNDFTILDKTTIYRQHRDRFEIADTLTIDELEVSLTTNIPDVPEDPHLWNGVATFSHPYLQNRQLIEIVIDTNPFVSAKVDSFDTTTGTITFSATSYAQDYTANLVFHYTYVDKVRRKVDLYSEGLTPILYKTTSNMIKQSVDTEWALIYKNANNITPTDYNQVNPVDCYLAPVLPTKLNVVASPYFGITGDMIENGILSGYYCNKITNSGSIVFTYDGVSKSWFLYNTYDVAYCVSFETELRPEPALHLTYYKYYKSTNSIEILEQRYVDSNNAFTLYSFADGEDKMHYYKGTFISKKPNENTANATFNLVLNSREITTFEQYDRTDSRFVKIFLLPYCPAIINSGNLETTWTGILNADNNTTYDLQLNDLNSKFDYTFKTNLASPFETLVNKLSTSKLDGKGRLLELKSADNETKLYHSDYYRPTFVYDSFTFPFYLERVNTTALLGIYSNLFQLRYVITTTINSKFMFGFPEYTLNHSTEDFDNVLNIARNNEAVLYTNQYINYLRTGYNYDVKSRWLNAANSVLSVIAGTAGGITIASIAKTGGKALMASAIISGATSLIMSANSIANNELSLEAKIKQHKYQSVHTEGSDDVDLLEAYSNNRAYLNYYEVSDRLKKALFKVFFYTGYTYELMEVPNMTSRIRFNFCMANLEIKRSANMPQYAEEDLKSRWSQGITRIHNVHGTWDFDQQYENWEVSLGGIY